MRNEHHFEVDLEWTGNRGTGTDHYRSYGRDHIVRVEAKHEISGSSAPVFHGDRDRWNPEELLIAALSQCHLLSYLHVAAANGIVVLSYSDAAFGTIVTAADDSGKFTSVTLRPLVTIAAAAPEANSEANSGANAKANLDFALALHHEASKKCFIAASVNFPVHHEPRVLMAPRS